MWWLNNPFKIPGSGSTTTLPIQQFYDYSVDFWQRNALFWDTLRRRGNQYIENDAKLVKHVLDFDFEIVAQGTELPQPCNYGLVRIVPPEGVEIDEEKRPFVVIDPRAGHGPGIGGFKPDSQIGVALRAGHPCYFIGFLDEPVAGQTLGDVGLAEITFLEKVASMHPAYEGRPCVIGNCQAGWAVMMLGAVDPDVVGPLMVNGAPLSYWAGVRGKNPMRYLGGMLGGTWLTALTGDLGNGIFDGAWLVHNFENLNPSNTYWSKHYNLWSKIDTEPQRYLEFEKWWGAHVLLTADEMLSIADNLFVGNRLTRGELQTADGRTVDIRNIRSPIVVFCSQGDNITPPQQALGWIVDLYENVDEIIAYGQTIVYAVHDDIGHLGIFVSGKVGKKEHDQFTQNMDLVDVLPPGLYEAVIRDKTADDANAELAAGDYVVTFETRTLEDIRALGTQGEEDDRAFDAVHRLSEINQGLYRTLLAPFVKGIATEQGAELMRQLHPARLQYSMLSDQNPFLGWTAAAAQAAKADRQPVAPDNMFLAMEKQMSEAIVASLDSYRDLRDRSVEQIFFGFYGSEFVQALLGLQSSSEHAHRYKAPRDAAHDALIETKIARSTARISEGDARDGAVRALVYILLAEGRIDERGFGALKHMHAEASPDERSTLQEFKQRVREQFYMLRIDESGALAALPTLIPDMEARRDIYGKVETLVTSAGTPSAVRAQRLRELARRLELDGGSAEPPLKVVDQA